MDQHCPVLPLEEGSYAAVAPFLSDYLLDFEALRILPCSVKGLLHLGSLIQALVSWFFPGVSGKLIKRIGFSSFFCLLP